MAAGNGSKRGYRRAGNGDIGAVVTHPGICLQCKVVARSSGYFFRRSSPGKRAVSKQQVACRCSKAAGIRKSGVLCVDRILSEGNWSQACANPIYIQSVQQPTSLGIYRISYLDTFNNLSDMHNIRNAIEHPVNC